jgi:gliding motility-associated protein GldL
MVKIRKYANVIERFLHGQKGQRFFNFAYSIGAAIVIWGALFKILHLPGGSTLLCIGMGTEIAMFILTAFDRPPKDYAWEEVFPVLDSHDADQRPDFSTGGGIIINGGVTSSDEEYQPQQGVAGGGVQGAVAPTLPYTGLTEEDADSLHESIVKMAAASEQLSRMAELTTATQDYLAQISSISEQMQRLSQTTEALNQVSDVLLNSYTAITNNSDRINENSNGYVAQMEDLNRNIGGLNTIYEIQLKSISSQLESIDRVNRGLKDIRDMYEKSAHESSRYCEETERMARYMRQLNQVYEKMITAMTVNMANPMMGGVQQNPFNNNEAGNNL